MIPDDEYGPLLLRPLADEPRSPSTVDITRAVTEGRRKRRLRKIRTSCAGAAAVAVVLAVVVAGVPRLGLQPPNDPGNSGPTPAPAPSSAPIAEPSTGPVTPPATRSPIRPTACAVSRLQIPRELGASAVTGGDPTGRFLVGHAGGDPEGDNAVLALLWDDGVPQQVNLPGAPVLTGVSTAGVVVGYSRVDGVPKPFAYGDGTAQPLRGVSQGEAMGINTAGAIVGNDRGDPKASRPVVWPSATAERPIRLAVPAGSGAVATGIGDDGTVVGLVDARPYAWPRDGGPGRFLPTPPGRWTAESLRIRSDWVVGAGDAGGKRLGLLWNLRTDEVTQTSAFASYPLNVNASGLMVGRNTNRDALLAPEPLMSLPELTNVNDKLGSTARVISDDGRTIGGEAVDPSLREAVAVVWRCT